MLKMSAKLGNIVWIYLILFCSHASSDNSDEDVDCDPPWQKVHRSCVQFMKAKPFLSWQQARDSCISMNSDLLCINDVKEKNKVNFLLKTHVKSFDLLDWWIGLRQVNDTGTWSWVDNEILNTNLINWAKNEGSGVSEDGTLITDQCALLNYQGYLKDELCDLYKPYICEQIKLTPPPSPSTRAISSSTTQAPSSPTTTPTQTSVAPTTTTTEKEKPTLTPTPQTGTPKTKPPTSKPTDKPQTGPTTDKPTTGEPTDKPNTGRPTDKPHTGEPTDKPQTGRTDKPTTGEPTDKPNTGRPTNKPTGKPTDKPHTRPTDAPESTTETTRKPDKDEFLGCYAVNLESTCPPVEAFGISWPRTEAGKNVKVPCDKGQARWKCDKKPTCWRDEPDVKQCTSESIQELTNQMDEFLADLGNAEKTKVFTENLASAAGSDTVLTEQDIYQSTKLMNAAAQAKPKNSSEAKNIIKNVAKCGSLLVSNDKKNTWSSMTKESQRTVASSLLNSMESVTMQMLNSFDEPTVEKIEEENMSIELQVIDVNVNGPDSKNAVYEGESNNFAIPPENLQQFSTGGLARLVFINYNNVGELLVPVDENAVDSTERQLISQVVSASLGEKTVDEPLTKPVTFTMKTENRAKNEEWKQLCSFWNFSLGYTGAWSQRGCSLKKYNITHTTCQCDHLTNFAILMDIHSTKLTQVHATTLSVITYVGIIISIICLFLSWVTFICLSSVQGERNSIHKNLAFCLFIAEVLFLAGIERTDNKIACAIIAGFLHYFFLSSFTWMFVEGVHILFMLVQVFDAAKSRLRYYYLIGYGAPLLTVGISALVYYEGYGTERYCWLTTERMFIWSFAGPVAFILLVNLMILIYAMSAVCKHSEYVFAKEKSATGNIKAWVQGALALEVLLGLTWVFGYFYISEEAIPMAYLFTIFNSLQGLFIFVFHCILNKKVRKEYKRFIDYPRRPVSSGTHSSSKGFHHHNGSGPQTSAYNLNGTRKSSGFVDLSKDRRQSNKSTTSA